jgi:TRAP-type C4-dicarboxylate transport system permease small subunit
MIEPETNFAIFLNRLIKTLNGINIFLVFPFLVVLILLDIALRSVVNSPISWAHEVSGLLLICLFFLALPGCIKSQSLLKVDFVYQFLSLRQQRYAHQLSLLLVLLFAILLAAQGYLGVKESLEYDERAYTIDIPYWPFYALVSIVGVISALQTISDLCKPGVQRERTQTHEKEVL